MTNARVLDRLREHGLIDSGGFVEAYEVPRVSAISALIEALPGDDLQVLDIGFLDGRVPLILSELDVRKRLSITGTERDASSCDAARAKAGRLGLQVDILEFDLSVATDVLHGREFDVVILGEVVEHLPPNVVPEMFVALRSLLRLGGTLIVTTPNLHSLSFRLRHALGIDFTHDPIPAAEWIGYGHIALWSARALCDLGRAAGLEPTSIDFHDFTSAHRDSKSWRRAVKTVQGRPSRGTSRTRGTT